MTITVTSIGANTAQITTSGTDNTVATFTQAVADVITGVAPSRTTGWTLHDSSYVSVFGAMATSPVLTQVFRALNADAVTYKYMIFRWDTLRQILNTSCCESWNATTHVPTNESWNFFGSAPISFNIHSCDFILMTNPRWLVATSFLNNEASLWAGTFEMAREDVADTAAAGYPCFGWISSTLWSLGASSYGAAPLAASGNTLICLPRTRMGNTGVAATYPFAGDYGVALLPPFTTTTYAPMVYQVGTSVNKWVTSAWNSANRMVLPIKPIFNNTSVSPLVYGQIFGLKVLAPSGNQMNKISLPVGSDSNYDPSGTSADHWLLNTHIKPYSADQSSFLSNTYLIKTSVNVASTRVDKMEFVGQFYYCMVGVSLYKVNGINNQNTQITLASGNVQNIAYDGERYLYISTNVGLTKLDTTDDSMVNLAITNGSVSVAITKDAIYSAPSSVVSPVITKIVRSTFVLESGAVNSFTSGIATLTSFTEAVRLHEAIVDADGNAWFAPCVSAAGNFKLVRITNLGVISYVTSNLQNITWQISLKVLDNQSIYVQQLATATAVVSTDISNTGGYVNQYTTTVTTASVSSKSNNYYGDVMSCVNIAGQLFTVMRQPGTSVQSGWVQPLGSANGALPTPITWNAGFLPGLTGGNASYSAMWTDGARLFVNTDVGFNVITRVNAESCYTGANTGQASLPV